VRRAALISILPVFVLAGCGGGGNDKSATSTAAGPATATTPAPGAGAGQLQTKPKVTVPSGKPPTKLVSKDIVTGTGATAQPGDTVSVHYVGVSYANKKQFDASWDRHQPFTFQLGGGMVIPGWDQGVVGMKVGGRRRITIPPMLAYGKRGAGGVIGPDETLVFVVDLISVR
jgi:peptidylprolyl isomerase